MQRPQSPTQLVHNLSLSLRTVTMTLFALVDVEYLWILPTWSIAALAGAIAVLSFLRSPHKIEQGKGGRRLPPLVDGGFRTVAPIFFSSRAPFFMVECARKYGKVFRLPLVPRGHFVVVTDHALARTILETPGATKPRALYSGFDAVFGGETMFTAEGHRWNHSRKATNFAFAPGQKQRMTAVVLQSLRKWMDASLEPKIRAMTPVDFAQEMQFVTIGVIGQIAFDHELSPEEAVVIKDGLKLMYVEFLQKTGKNPLRRLVGFAFPGIHRARRASREISAILRDILARHREKANPVAQTIISAVNDDPEYANDDERVRDLFGYLVGGFDTTSYSLAWTLLELARHPGEQTRLRDELRRCDGDDERRRCPALKRVVRESLRLHATAALGSARTVARDVAVPGAGRVIPAGSVVDVPFFAIHRDRDVFDRADEFVPGRWEDPSEEALRSVMGFSVGKRNCQGQMLANVELTVILAELCTRFEFSVAKEGHAEYYVTYKPVGSLLNVKEAG